MKIFRVNAILVTSLLVLALTLSPRALRPQTLAQDLQQLALDYQKLAQLKQMLQNMYSAYARIEQGYEQVKSIAAGNFNLHKAFLDALLAVSPVVREDVKVQRVIDKETELVREYQTAKTRMGGSGRFTASELDYFNTLYGGLLNGSLRNLDELAMILTAGELRMSDAERLAAVDRIDHDMTDKLGFLRAFNNYAAIQAGQRALESNDIGAMKGLWGIQP